MTQLATTLTDPAGNRIALGDRVVAAWGGTVYNRGRYLERLSESTAEIEDNALNVRRVPVRDLWLESAFTLAKPSVATTQLRTDKSDDEMQEEAALFGTATRRVWVDPQPRSEPEAVRRTRLRRDLEADKRWGLSASTVSVWMRPLDPAPTTLRDLVERPALLDDFIALLVTHGFVRAINTKG